MQQCSPSSPGHLTQSNRIFIVCQLPLPQPASALSPANSPSAQLSSSPPSAEPRSMSSEAEHCQISNRRLNLSLKYENHRRVSDPLVSCAWAQCAYERAVGREFGPGIVIRGSRNAGSRFLNRISPVKEMKGRGIQRRTRWFAFHARGRASRPRTAIVWGK